MCDLTQIKIKELLKFVDQHKKELLKPHLRASVSRAAFLRKINNTQESQIGNSFFKTRLVSRKMYPAPK